MSLSSSQFFLEDSSAHESYLTATNQQASYNVDKAAQEKRVQQDFNFLLMQHQMNLQQKDAEKNIRKSQMLDVLTLLSQQHNFFDTTNTTITSERVNNSLDHFSSIASSRSEDIKDMVPCSSLYSTIEPDCVSNARILSYKQPNKCISKLDYSISTNGIPKNSAALAQRRMKSSAQLKVLREFFALQQKPTNEAVTQLMTKTGLSIAQIRRWFRNERFKANKFSRGQPTSTDRNSKRKHLDVIQDTSFLKTNNDLNQSISDSLRKETKNTIAHIPFQPKSTAEDSSYQFPKSYHGLLSVRTPSNCEYNFHGSSLYSYDSPQHSSRNSISSSFQLLPLNVLNEIDPSSLESNQLTDISERLPKFLHQLTEYSPSEIEYFAGWAPQMDQTG